MKTHCLLLLAIVAINCMMFTASAQEAKSDKKLKVEFGIGINCSGPQMQMGDLMRKYGYSYTEKVWIKIFKNSKDYITYPIYSSAGFTTQIDFSYPIAKRSQLGIMVNYSGFGEVKGYSSVNGYLDVHLSNISIIPFYTYEVKDYLEIQAGPAVMVNSCDKYELGSPVSEEQYTIYSLGLFTGLNLKLWDRTGTFGKIGANYLLTTDCKMGPYTSENFGGNSQIFPESKINFSHLNLFFAFGLKL